MQPVRMEWIGRVWRLFCRFRPGSLWLDGLDRRRPYPAVSAVSAADIRHGLHAEVGDSLHPAIGVRLAATAFWSCDALKDVVQTSQLIRGI